MIHLGPDSASSWQHLEQSPVPQFRPELILSSLTSPLGFIETSFLRDRPSASWGCPVGQTTGLEQAMLPTLPGPPTLSQVVALVVPPFLLRFMTSAAG